MPAKPTHFLDMSNMFLVVTACEAFSGPLPAYHSNTPVSHRGTDLLDLFHTAADTELIAVTATHILGTMNIAGGLCCTNTWTILMIPTYFGSQGILRIATTSRGNDVFPGADHTCINEPPDCQGTKHPPVESVISARPWMVFMQNCEPPPSAKQDKDHASKHQRKTHHM